MATVKYDSTVTADEISLLVFANGHPISVEPDGGKWKFSFNGTIGPGKVLIITYKIEGLNATEYSISYKCTVDRVEKKDPEKESPVENSISEGNMKTETITIKC
jgi:hypothetical protein